MENAEPPIRRFNNRNFTEELRLIPKVEPWYIMPKEVQNLWWFEKRPTHTNQSETLCFAARLQPVKQVWPGQLPLNRPALCLYDSSADTDLTTFLVNRV